MHSHPHDWRLPRWTSSFIIDDTLCSIPLWNLNPSKLKSSRHHPSPEDPKSLSATADVPSNSAAQLMDAKSHQRCSSSHPVSFRIFHQKSTSSAAPKPLPRAIFPFNNAIQSPHTPADSIYECATMLRNKKTQYTLIPRISPGHNIHLLV